MVLVPNVHAIGIKEQVSIFVPSLLLIEATPSSVESDPLKSGTGLPLPKLIPAFAPKYQLSVCF
jgi:hypothetical protein